jgi:hypothetical protein
MLEVPKAIPQALKGLVDTGGHVIGPVSKQQAHALRQMFYRWRMRVNAERGEPLFGQQFAGLLEIEGGAWPYLRMLNEVVVLVEQRQPGIFWVKFEEYGKPLSVATLVETKSGQPE